MTRPTPLSPTTERRLWIAAAAGLTLSAAGILLPGRLVLQARSPQSVPFTVGVQVAAPTRWHTGDLVAFRTGDLSPYYPAGTPFTKAVAGIPGDRIVRLGRDFYLNGRYIATARETDSNGRPASVFSPLPLPVPLCVQPRIASRSCREPTAPLVPDGALFVLGRHERSYDSRYWGYVQHETIFGRVVALL